MSSDGESNCLEISAEPTSEFEAGNRRTNNACKHKCRYICFRPVSFAVNYTCSVFVKQSRCNPMCEFDRDMSMDI